MKKLRLYYWLIKAYLRRHRFRAGVISGLVLLFVINFGFLAAHFYQPFYNTVDRYLFKPEINEGVVSSIRVINPIFASTSGEREVSKLVFRGLTKSNNQGEVIPDLAEKVEVKSDKDYIFTLRKNTYWHDGQKVTADDVVYTYKALISPELKTNFQSSFKDTEIKKIDDDTIEFILKDSFSPFLAETAVGIIPEHIPLDKFKPIGTGQFRVISFNRDRAVLESLSLRLIVKSYPTADLALLALKQGEIQNIGGLNFDQIKELTNWKNLRILEAVYGNRYLAVFFNVRNPTLSSRLVRQALLETIDKNKILAIDSSQVGEPTLTSMGRNSWARTDEVKKYDRNLDLARANLDKEGWLVKEGVRSKDNKPLVLNIVYNDTQNYNRIVSQIEEDLKQVNINLVKRPLGSNQLRDQIVKERDFDLLLGTDELEADPDQYVFWHSTQANLTNITGLSSVKVDKALEDGRLLTNVDDRKNKYKEFEKSLVDEAPALFLYYPKYYYVINSRLEKLELNSFNSPVSRFDSINTWKVRRQIL